MKKDVTIIVAAHKKSEMPKDDMYLPLHVGAEGKKNPDGTPLDLGYTKDNTGENISARNYNFGTQTGLYWMWKNVDSDYKGLVHYRRFFTLKKASKKNMLESVLTYDELKPMLGKYKVFVPRKRRYYIETVYSQYVHTLDRYHQLDISREVISEKTPDYLQAFDKVMNRRWNHMFNMMILTKELMNDYCTWMFPILFEVFERVDKSQMDTFDLRFPGRVSERLFNVWLEKKIEEGTIKPEEIKELHYVEDVDWMFKVRKFLMAKFLHQKYGKSS